jgi:hypothetical protein
MNARHSRTFLLAGGLILSTAAALTPSTGLQSAANAGTLAASMATPPADRGAAPSTVLALANRCIDPRHVALVNNAVRRGRVVSVGEARGWCD